MTFSGRKNFFFAVNRTELLPNTNQ